MRYTKSLPFKLTWGPHTAMFSSHANAAEYAVFITRRSGYHAELSNKTGLIGQWDNAGNPSPEFKAD